MWCWWRWRCRWRWSFRDRNWKPKRKAIERGRERKRESQTERRIPCSYEAALRSAPFPEFPQSSQQSRFNSSRGHTWPCASAAVPFTFPTSPQWGSQWQSAPTTWKASTRTEGLPILWRTIIIMIRLSSRIHLLASSSESTQFFFLLMHLTHKPTAHLPPFMFLSHSSTT